MPQLRSPHDATKTRCIQNKLKKIKNKKKKKKVRFPHHPTCRTAWSEPMFIGWMSPAPSRPPPPLLTPPACSSSLGDRDRVKEDKGRGSQDGEGCQEAPR